MQNKSRWALVLLCAPTIFLSAFLLFQVQPMVSKMILPWFGGSPAVWTTCMLFFQVFLLGGYAYAHLLTQVRRPMWQTVVHMALLLAAALTLPIQLSDSWKPVDSSQPTLRILVLLCVNVGLPYFLLASTGPLVQAWYSMALSGRSPYRLYALSNVGSLGALLSYPFVFEPAFRTSEQSFAWAIGFVVFAACCGSLAALVWRTRVHHAAAEDADEKESAGQPPEKPLESVAHEPTVGRTILWLLLPALASMTLIAVTNHVCQDVAPNPFLWVVPLSLYLLTFIICFDREAWYVRRTFAVVTTLGIVFISLVMLGPVMERFLGSLGHEVELPYFGSNLAFEVISYLAAMFLICMLCHGELVRLKPAPRHLTRFYLMISLGGALGGVFVALICPVIFSSYLETNIALVGGIAVALVILIGDARRSWGRRRAWLQLPAILLVFGATMLVVFAQARAINTGGIAQSRNFYGVLRVEEVHDELTPRNDRRVLMHGRIKHGIQFLHADRQMIPTTYYKQGTGVALAIKHSRRDRPLRVAVVGLGTGTLAAHGREGDVFRFYEINPTVVEFARRFFTFLELSPATIEIVVGDARLQMERETPQNYDVIALDAFSGDAIPVHLLTREAFDIYLRHLKPGGVLAVHVSNRHLYLSPVVAALSDYFQMKCIAVHWDYDDIVKTTDFLERLRGVFHVWVPAESKYQRYVPPDVYPSSWVLVTTNEKFLAQPEIVDAASGVYRQPDLRLWTDEYWNMLKILK